MRRAVVLRHQICQDVVEKPLEVAGLTELWSVAGAILQGVCDDDPVGAHVVDAGWLKTHLELVWCDIKGGLAASAHDLRERPHGAQAGRQGGPGGRYDSSLEGKTVEG